MYFLGTMAVESTELSNRMAQDFYKKALSALDRNNLDYAIEMFQQCLSLEPGYVKGRQYLRATQMKRAESAGGFKRMLSAAKLTPQITKARMTIGKNPTEAMSLAEHALSEDPKNGQALMVLAEASEAAKLPEVTVQTLEHYAKLHPRDTKGLHWLARTYGVLNRWDLAGETYDKLLKMNPGDSEAQQGAKDASAHGAMQTGGWEEADTYRDVMKDKTEAVALEQDSRVIRAEDMLSNLIKENLAKLAQEPDNQVIQRELGKLYAQKGEYEEALKYLETIFVKEAGADPTLEKEILDVKAKRLAQTISEKKQQLASNPANAAALENEIASLQIEYDKVLLTDAERLVERYPNDLNYRYELAVLYMKTGNLQGAIEQFQRSVGQPQRRTSSLNYLGQCFQQLGLHDLAIDQYSRAIEEIPTMDGLKKELTYNLASAYEALSQWDKALGEYKKIAAVDFAFKDVRQKITQKPPAKPA
jgi:tetratricopeptide (TPR) repeat protein